MRQDLEPFLDAGTPAGSEEWDEALHMFEAMCVRERLADLGARASAIGHELRQPLFTISMANENIRLMLSRPDIPRDQIELATERIAEQIQRAQTIIARVLEQASGTPAESARADPVAAMGNAIRFLDGLFEHAGVRVESPLSDLAFLVPLDRVETEQVFVNVLRNAVDSIRQRQRAGWDGAGRIAVSFIADDSSLRCLVTDNGAGLPDGKSQMHFRPFVTTKASEGTGLGLYICERIVAAVGGAIRLRPGAIEGAEVEICFPLATGRRASDRAEPQG